MELKGSEGRVYRFQFDPIDLPSSDNLIRILATAYLQEGIGGTASEVAFDLGVEKKTRGLTFLKTPRSARRRRAVQKMFSGSGEVFDLVLHGIKIARSGDASVLSAANPIAQLALRWIGYRLWRGLAHRPGYPVLNVHVRYEAFFDFIVGLEVLKNLQNLSSPFAIDEALKRTVLRRLADRAVDIARDWRGLELAPFGSVLLPHLTNEVRHCLGQLYGYPLLPELRELALRDRTSIAREEIENAFEEFQKPLQPVSGKLAQVAVRLATEAQEFVLPVIGLYLLQDWIHQSGSPWCEKTMGPAVGAALYLCVKGPDELVATIRGGVENFRQGLAENLERRYPCAKPLSLADR